MCKSLNLGLTESQETNVLFFANSEEYKNALATVNSLSSEELKSYEVMNGYESFGRKCDDIYNTINPDIFKSVDEVKSFVAANSNYLQLIPEDNGEYTLETVCYNNPNRYFANEDMLFQIENNVYKIFDDVTVSSGLENIEIIKSINADNYTLFENDSEIFFSENHSQISMLKDGANDCGSNPDPARATNNRDRTKVELNLYEQALNNQYLVNASYSVRPYKKTLGVWYYCSRTISCDLKVRVDYLLSGSDWVNRPIKTFQKSNYYGSVISGDIDVFWVPSNPSKHFGGFDCWGDTPSTSTAHLECHTNIF